MKKLCLVLLVFTGFAWAEANPASYTVNVHVSASQQNERHYQYLDVVIDGKKYVLVSYGPPGVLAPGDYKARLVKNTHKTPYYSTQTYEFLYPDGSTERFNLAGQKE